MTATGDLLATLFDARVAELAAEKNLTEAESRRICAVFRQALANPFMDENQIYLKLIGREPAT